MSWVIAIPSFRRSVTLHDKTLRLLNREGLLNRVTVFVVPEEEEEYKVIVPYVKVVVGVEGMANQRNFMTSYYPVGTKILYMDDDIKGMIEYDDESDRREKPLVGLKEKVDKWFEILSASGFRLFGIYPVANGYFMKKGFTMDLRYIIGSFYGIINPGIDELEITLDDKEDYLRTLLMYIYDGGVVRFTDVSVVTAYYYEKGGMQVKRTEGRVLASAKSLVRDFPDLCTLNLTKKSGYAEIRLKDRRWTFQES